jgi:general secretion pathway protein I
LQVGETSGIENNVYQWWIETSPFMFNPDNVDPKTLTAELFKVKITVSWSDGGASDRQVELITLKLINKTL